MTKIQVKPYASGDRKFEKEDRSSWPDRLLKCPFEKRKNLIRTANFDCTHWEESELILEPKNGHNVCKETLILPKLSKTL